MRFALAISFWAASGILGMLYADDGFVPVSVRDQTAYIIPEEYASAHKADFLNSLTSYLHDVDFWTPSETDVLVMDRVLRDWIHDGSRDVGLIFPDMANYPENFAPGEIDEVKSDLGEVDQNYDNYTEQFVGVVVDGQKWVICNYSIGTKVDPSLEYIFMQKTFEANKGMHFLQAWFDPEAKSCSKLAMVGLWQDSE